MAGRGRVENLSKGGRPKGSKNKYPIALKEMILQALDKAGGVDYLLHQAHENPSVFLGLVGKTLPLTVKGEGENGGVVIEVITGVPRDDK